MVPDLIARIQAAASDKRFPSAISYRSLPLAAIARIASELGLPGHEVERQALRLHIWPERYCRNAGSYTPEQQARLLASCVAVIGLGGLGGMVCELLARSGVGQLVLVDGDRFDESNLNRQLLATSASIEASKSAAAAARLMQVNPSVVVHASAEFLDEDNAKRLLRGCQVAVDCLDNFQARRQLAQAAQHQGIALVSAAVAGACGQLTVIYPDDPDPCALWPSDTQLHGIEASIGCLPHAVALMASLECSEATGMLLGRDSHLRRRLLLVDLDAMLCQILELGNA